MPDIHEIISLFVVGVFVFLIQSNLNIVKKERLKTSLKVQNYLAVKGCSSLGTASSLDGTGQA
jgi:hypothetical protein